MSNKIILLSILFATAVFISGCINNDEPQVNTQESAFIPKTNLPSGFTYMATHETALEIGNTSINAAEGVYRYKDGYFRIQIIKDDNPVALMTQYKLQLKERYKNDYNPFAEIYLNEHKATQVTDYSIINGQQTPLYTVFWTNSSYMIIVTSEEPTDAWVVIALASATGG